MEASRMDTELPFKMAHLDIMEIGESSEQKVISEPCARVLRRRKFEAPEATKCKNRRVSRKPRKHILSENANPKQIESLYLNKKVKTSTQTLETIYEEPKSSSSESDPMIGRRKVKRLLTFHTGSHYTKEKIRKRRAKIKKLLGNKFLSRKKIPMNVFLKTIECLELDEVVHSDNTKTVDSDPV